jgi:dihydrofolate reductase
MPTHGQRLVVRCFMMSVDGFAAGPNQSLEKPFGDHTEGFTDWVFATRSGRQLMGIEGGEENEDDPYMARSFDNIGAAILGRNMFGPSRGPWTDDGWKGWWGPNPPYHAPTFVLTHHPREPMPMDGGTTFHFATGSIGDTLEQAFAAADGKDVRLVGGAATVGQYLAAQLVDELHLVIVPMLIGCGERVFTESSPPPGYVCVEHTATPSVVHLRFERCDADGRLGPRP